MRVEDSHGASIIAAAYEVASAAPTPAAGAQYEKLREVQDGFGSVLSLLETALEGIQESALGFRAHPAAEEGLSVIVEVCRLLRKELATVCGDFSELLRRVREGARAIPFMHLASSAQQ